MARVKTTDVNAAMIISSKACKRARGRPRPSSMVALRRAHHDLAHGLTTDTMVRHICRYARGAVAERRGVQALQLAGDGGVVGLAAHCTLGHLAGLLDDDLFVGAREDTRAACAHRAGRCSDRGQLLERLRRAFLSPPLPSPSLWPMRKAWPSEAGLPVGPSRGGGELFGLLPRGWGVVCAFSCAAREAAAASNSAAGVAGVFCGRNSELKKDTASLHLGSVGRGG